MIDTRFDERAKSARAELDGGAVAPLGTDPASFERVRERHFPGVAIRRTLFLSAVIAFFAFRVEQPARIQCAPRAFDRVDCFTQKMWLGVVPSQTVIIEDVRRARMEPRRFFYVSDRDPFYFFLDVGDEMRTGPRMTYIDAQQATDLRRVTREINAYLKSPMEAPYSRMLRRDFLEGCLALLAFTTLVAFVERMIKRRQARRLLQKSP